MSEYEQYVTAVNKIYEHIAKLKSTWSDQDSQNLIENIEQYKQAVVNSANLFPKQQAQQKVEALGND